MSDHLKNIDKAITDFTMSRNKLKVQETALEILNYAAPKAADPNARGHGNCEGMLKLAQVIPKPWADQLTNWCKEYSPIRVVIRKSPIYVGYDPIHKTLKCEPETMTQEEMNAVMAERLKWWNLQGAASTPFIGKGMAPSATSRDKLKAQEIAILILKSPIQKFVNGNYPPPALSGQAETA